ncbi:formyltransferase family protein [Arenibacterium halophilum]|uniref:phosphoribosylglycinamide formyltransferase 1 n=1 Tax=Arenibacterium halophilum TaxID=2583821 RepID=A0ABY2XCN9_9RHOB|nr:formyltransferase family protein [Arenibacterium halophilum]TMV13507.1 hypothetical protein FGK64_12280 [Arenibacterium halophilum]
MIGLCAVCSAGGSAFFTAFDMAREAGLVDPGSTLVLTDRPCDAEARAVERDIAHRRIDWTTRDAFSTQAAEEFRRHDITFGLLYFLRLIGPELYEGFEIQNIHPSLLPAFPGFGAVRAARGANARFLGATLHNVDGSIDAGPIVAQVVSPLPNDASPETDNKLSYVQKVYLTLVAIERAAGPCVPRVTASANPALAAQALRAAFAGFLADNAPGAMQP